MDDTFVTVRSYDKSRLEYDASRADIELMQGQNGNKKDLENELTECKEKYEQLKRDVSIKLKFLEENRVKVMAKQLDLFNRALSAYYSADK
jgi:arfaptin